MKKIIIFCLLLISISCKKEGTEKIQNTTSRDSLTEQTNDFSKTEFKDRAEELVYIREYLNYKLPKILVAQNPEQIKKVQHQLIANGQNPTLEEAAKKSINFSNKYEIYMNLIISENTSFTEVKKQLESTGKLDFNFQNESPQIIENKDTEQSTENETISQEVKSKPVNKAEPSNNTLDNILNTKKTEIKNTENNTGSGNSYGGVVKSVNKETYLAGRIILEMPKKAPSCNEQGKVVIQVTVNRTGNVIDAKLGRGTTNMSKCLVDVAIECAKKAKWNQSNEAPETQIGYLTYNFKLTE